MQLTHQQKRFLKRNIRTLSIDEIANKLDVPSKKIHEYLKDIWGKQKYEKHIKLRNPNVQKFKMNTSFSFRPFIKAHWGSIAFLSILVFISYFNSLSNAFVSDDVAGIAKNNKIGDLTTVLSQPLNIRGFLYYFTYKLVGLNPILYRLTNVLSHLGTVFGLYLLVYVLFSEGMLALFVASLFAVHPLLSESVTWISGGPYTQYTFFLVFSLLVYALSKQRKLYYFLSLIFFFFGLMINEKALIFPLILTVFEVSFSNLKKNWKRLIPFFSLSGVWVILLLTKIGTRVTELKTNYYQQGNGFNNPTLQIPVAVTSYLELIFWPGKLTLYHSELIFNQLQFLFRFIGLLILFIIMIILYRRKNILFFWLSFFIIGLLPTLTPFKVSWVVAERYAYFSTIGILFIVAYGLYGLYKIKKLETLSLLIFMVIILGLSARTIIRNYDWKDEDALYIATAKYSQSSPNTHNNLGDVYGKRGDLPRAVSEFQKAIKINPKYADAYHNLGNTYQQMGRMNDALENYKKAASLNPQLWQSYQNIAAVYFKQGQYGWAVQNIKQAIQISPQNANLYVNLAVVYTKENQKELAKQAITKALQIDPANETAKKLLQDIALGK